MDIAFVCLIVAVLLFVAYAGLPLALVVEARLASLLLGGGLALMALALALWVNDVKV